MMRACALALAGLLCIPQLGWGYEIPLKPEGCVRLVVSVSQSCEVKAVYRCAEAGIFWAEVHEQGALKTIVRNTLDYREIGIVGINQKYAVLSDPSKQRPLHPQDVMATGTGQTELQGELYLIGISREISASVELRYDGQTKVFRGVTYAQLEGHIKLLLPPPAGMVEGKSLYYYDPKSGVLLEEPLDGMVFVKHDPIIDVLHPGDEGFDSNLPPETCRSISALGSDALRRAG